VIIPGLNRSRASCAAASRDGSMASSARNSRQAASLEIGAVARSDSVGSVVDSAFGEKVAIRS
jgi:hypothetical protein